MMKEQEMAIVTSGFSLLLAISANPVKDFKCFMKFKRSFCPSPLSGDTQWTAADQVVELLRTDRSQRSDLSPRELKRDRNWALSRRVLSTF